MRRSLLTTAGGASPFTMGQTPVTSGTSNATGFLLVDTSHAAPHGGTLTQVQCSLGGAASGNFTVVTGTLSGTTFTVKQVATLSGTNSNTVQTFTVSVPVDAGDFIGYWGNGPSPRAEPSGSGSSSQKAQASAPTVGAITGMSNVTQPVCIGASGA